MPTVGQEKTFPESLNPTIIVGTVQYLILHNYMQFLVEANQDRLTKMENKKLLNSVMLHHGEHLMQGKSHLKESKATWWEQFSILFRRGLKERRHEYFSCMRVIQVISTAIIVGLLWWHSNASSPKQLHDQASILHVFKISCSITVGLNPRVEFF